MDVLSLKKILSLFIAFIILGLSSVPALAIPDMQVAAKSALLTEVKSGETLYSQNADERVYPASITKIMTVLLAIENGNLDDIVTANQSAFQDISIDGSSADIKAGEQMTLLDLLYCIMLPSANEACNIVAEYISGDVASFIELMNKRAAELGAKDTHFLNTHGLHNENHYTTANDIVLITLEAVKHPIFLEICNTAKKEIPATNKSEERYLINTNHLISTLRESGYAYSPAKGIKTGHTTPAGYCLVSIAEKNNLTLLSVVMGAEQLKDTSGKTIIRSFTETTRLFEWGFNNFSSKVIVKSSEPVAEISVALGLDSDFVTVHPENTVSAILPNDFKIEDFEREITIYDEDRLAAPIEKDQVLGEMKISYEGREYASLKLLAVKEVERSNLLYILDRIKNVLSNPWIKVIIAAVIVLIIGYVVFTINYNKNRRNRSNYRGRRRKK